LLFASNGNDGSLAGISERKRRMVGELAQRMIRYGCGPRAATALMLGAKAWALFFVERNLDSSAGEDLARVALPALRHRVKPQFDWRDKYIKSLSLAEPSDEPGSLHDEMLWNLLLADLCLQTAPDQDGYDRPFQDQFNERLKSVQASFATQAKRTLAKR
jgi:hypothetical protein